MSRNDLDLTPTYPELGVLPATVDARSAVLDGEVVALDEKGAARFQLLQQGERRERIFVFDVLWLDGRDLRQLTYLERRKILVSFNRNQLWPRIDLQASYGLNGTAGNFGDLVDNATSGDSREWAIGVVVSIPLGNRVARANYHTSRLDSDQAVLNLKVLEQNIVVQVRNAVRLVQSNLKRVDASRVASRLADESLKAEQEKLKAGTSTSFLVLQAQAQLSAAQSAEVRARADYSKSLVDLARSSS